MPGQHHASARAVCACSMIARRFCFELLGRQAAQPVVAAEGHDQDSAARPRPSPTRGGAVRRPTCHPTRRRSPPCSDSPRASSRSWMSDGKLCSAIEAEAGGEAVAEEDDSRRVVVRRGECAGQRRGLGRCCRCGPRRARGRSLASRSGRHAHSRARKSSKTEKDARNPTGDSLLTLYGAWRRRAGSGGRSSQDVEHDRGGIVGWCRHASTAARTTTAVALSALPAAMADSTQRAPRFPHTAVVELRERTSVRQL